MRQYGFTCKQDNTRALNKNCLCLISGDPDVRESLARKVELVHPCPRAQLSLCVDASADHVGAVLQQRASPSAAWQALGFFSQKLSPAQVNYSAFDRELLACVEASGIFVLCWKAASSHCSRITNP